MRGAETERALAADARESSDSLESDGAMGDFLRDIARISSRPAPRAVIPGARWGADGRYLIERRLGHGGMGTVYAATDTLLGRRVAVKVLDEPVDDTGGSYRARVLREAQLAARVEHERLARVYDVGEHEGSPFVAMEYVAGETLRSWMAQPRSLGESLRVAVEMAEGLAVLHASGIIHRDLKPENVMFSQEGAVKLLDFGLARQGMLADLISGGTNAPAAVITEAAGTPGYMAPEQWSGEAVDARADVFALGVVLYELMFGERPFRGASGEAVRAATLAGVATYASASCPGVAGPLRRLVARCLLPAPEGRFADGSALLSSLRSATGESSSASRWSAKRFFTLAAAAAAVVACGLGGFALSRKHVAHAAPPRGMTAIEGGAMVVGRTPEQIAAQCQEIGPTCKHPLMDWQAPSYEVTLAPFLIDTREVTNVELAHVLELDRSNLRITQDKEDADHLFVRLDASQASDADLLVDLYPASGGIEVSADRHYAARNGREDLPAVQVSWFGAHFYCAAVGKRLPTEDEWEMAARGAEDRTYPWGEAAPRCGQVLVPRDGFVPMTGDCPTTTLVDLHRGGSSSQDRTPAGVEDMAGSVGEWTSSAFAEGGRDAHPSDITSITPRVLRGGSLGDSLGARTSVRNRRTPDVAAVNIGFRCAANLK